MSTNTTEREYNLGEQGYGSNLAENFCKLLETILSQEELYRYRYGYVPTTAHDIDKTGNKFTIVQFDGDKRFEIGEVEEGNGYSYFVLWAAYSGQPVDGFKETIDFFGRRHGVHIVINERRERDHGGQDMESVCWDVKANGTWVAHVFAGDAESTNPEAYETILEPQKVADQRPSDEQKHCLQKGKIGYCWHLATMLPHLKKAGV